MKRTGRPSWKPDLALVEKYASLGMSNEQICDCLGIHRSTFYRKLQEKKDFNDRLRLGKAKGVALVAGRCMERIQAGDASLIKFYLQRAGWGAPTIIENINPDEIRTMTTSQLRAILANTPWQA
jgi:hypothetical protein